MVHYNIAKYAKQIAKRGIKVDDGEVMDVRCGQH
jgi:hypothetical protein